ncbi:hypothetical protein ASPWEDRAFT_117557 [Aspergillus wentii DTO 134E9]|uniref:Carboxy-cis,cis-muconate cyclase n=1 Tax=Aspergillus wentii DTO 134E9 TaxID=1073089 RepID=A0A1L9RAN3_ASPWE|nr:uncharacterized protein ASPWEDRAFT_117557 [Aspergillus wentii DTO 134E9]KAI9934543.1 hypothetical protein MW887_000157 [Aspergillus wentii]OJJ31958.1 hypothetical protein ASPWEDRAFT_117557 [Aspergillus wentii DTO 134E9]
MHFSTLSLIAFLGSPCLGLHHFYSGLFAGDSLYYIAFDENTSELSVVSNASIGIDSSKWIALDKKHDNLYVTNGAQYNSYSIAENKTVKYQGSASISGGCDNANYIVSSTAEPFTVFGAPYSNGCPGQVISVDSTGTLNSVIANISYSNSSGAHGLALSSDNKFIYTGDDMGSAVWVHSYDATNNQVTTIQHIDVTGNPRHLVVHPGGHYVYVLLESGNEVAVYSRDSQTGKITNTNTTFSTIPSGYTNTSSYWSGEIMFSFPQEGESPKYLTASARSRESSSPGFVTAFSLDSTTGAIQKQLFLTPTTSYGGASNAISPAIFSEEYFAIADAGDNFVEVWKMNEESASVVAHLDMDYSPANLVWYD